MANDDYRDQHERDRAAGLAARHETRVERAIRRAVAEELRQLGEWRREYCRSCPQTAADYHAMDPMALSVHEEHATAAWLADIVEGKNDAMGWLPSWRWDDWTKLRAAGSKVAP